MAPGGGVGCRRRAGRRHVVPPRDDTIPRRLREPNEQLERRRFAALAGWGTGYDELAANVGAGNAVELTVKPSARQVAEVRRAARQALDAVPGPVVDDVLLALDEAVSNAVRHGSEAGRPIEVRLAVGGGWIELSVRDQGPTPRLPPLPRSSPTPLAPGGRGLWLILQLVDEVRLERAGEGVRLWLRRRAAGGAAARRSWTGAEG